MFSENLARRGGTAKQSSNYGSYHASKALDGNINQKWDGGSCSHTAVNRKTAWWRLDIGQQANIYNIVIYYRQYSKYTMSVTRSTIVSLFYNAQFMI